jgi:hypothetical protein
MPLSCPKPIFKSAVTSDGDWEQVIVPLFSSYTRLMFY